MIITSFGHFFLFFLFSVYLTLCGVFADNNCIGEAVELKDGKAIKNVRLTLYGDPKLKPVVILTTGKDVEWNRLTISLCNTGDFSIALVKILEKWSTEIWWLHKTIDEIRHYYGWDKIILYGKASGAYMALKYMQKSPDTVLKMGLFAPNVTFKGDIWSLNSRRMDIALFWCLEDSVIDFVSHASLWESTIEPPLISVSGCAVSHQHHRIPDLLIPPMTRFASLVPLISKETIAGL